MRGKGAVGIMSSGYVEKEALVKTIVKQEGLPLRPFILPGFGDRLDEGIRRKAGAPYEQAEVH